MRPLPAGHVHCGYCLRHGRVRDVREGKEVVVTCPICRGHGHYLQPPQKPTKKTERNDAEKL